MELLERNLQSAAELIQNFKQIAVDQSTELARSFGLKRYLTEVSQQP